MAAGENALGQFPQAAETGRVAGKVPRVAQGVGVQLVEPLAVQQRSRLELGPVGELLAQPEQRRLDLPQAGADELRPRRAERRDVQLRLVVAVPDDLALLVLVALGVVPGPDVAAAAQLAVVGVGVAARPVQIRELLQRRSAGFRVAVVEKL